MGRVPGFTVKRGPATPAQRAAMDAVPYTTGYKSRPAQRFNKGAPPEVSDRQLRRLSEGRTEADLSEYRQGSQVQVDVGRARRLIEDRRIARELGIDLENLS